jgi:hypothetical protein
MATPTERSLIHGQGTNTKQAADQLASREGIKVVKTFESDIFNGVSVESTSDNADSLKALKEINNVWKSSKIKLAPSIGMQSFSDDAAAANYDIHSMTGVDTLHEAGVFGKGAVVAIVDTGTYYTHPSVGAPLLEDSRTKTYTL